MQQLIINGEDILPNESKLINVNIAKLPSATSINIKVIVNRGSEDGPVLLLTAGLHGDEVNGIEILRRLIENDYHIPQKGTTICIPVINIYGFINFSRYVPDGKDINRTFPGNKNGSLAARISHFLMKSIVPNIDYGIDFHTGGASRSNYPQIRCVLNNPTNFKLADYFQAPFTINAPLLAKSLRHAASKLGKSILVYEGGETLRLDEMVVNEGVEGTLRVMHALDMIPDAPASQKENIILQKTSWVRSRYSGLFQSDLTLGQRINRSKVVGTVCDPFGAFKNKIKAPHAGYIIGLNFHPLVHQGDALVHIGIPT